uniref:Uricase n=1 Tax=Chromera velia CCMP2878 TaxID=1169474 RepID=A0A0G4FYI2_9ALVE|mmetsp:Transcript_53777/g.105171  ORF Transcript_53777/g.105171 Transcript_53777/m.105171 type:complete len:297 (-) Transcript_53777:1323-2213(-)|eukprot:Cvel_19257.t1-p1 / transcript=Cvel_19257.t1 / gene=Cvel_19257 / organism=Chromera_velia_CCMP2878 / gene_product=Uricase, putative / transcript_product=Uricase, putative / location=Cvel_scaffold1648:25297-29544(-) / protein_length=296 / sequence_SO=supercontig / SO=protein_coding / is_pseudo=false
MFRVEGQYGKTKVRVLRVRRSPLNPSVHDLCEVDVECLLEGDLETSYTEGSNANVVPTDTVKNTCYVIAKKSNFDSVEDFGLALIRHFLTRHQHLSAVTVSLQEKLWQRVAPGGQPHEHVFTHVGPEKRVAVCRGSRGGPFSVESGIADMKIMKTTQSGFEGYVVDEYTTLKPTRERIFCTTVDARWSFGSRLPEGRFGQINQKVRELMLQVFSGPSRGGEYSKSVQETMYKMAVKTLEEVSEVERVSLVLPNIHHFLFDLKRFGIENDNEIFFPTDDPSGLIKCSVSRGDARSRL